MQLLELQSDYKMKQLHFKYVLNTDKDFIRFRYIQNGFCENLEKFTDNQPSIKLFEQEVNSNKAQISLEKSKITRINRRCLLGHSKHKRLFKTVIMGLRTIWSGATAFNSNIKNNKKALEINSQIAE
jgi:cobalt-zinc-cadmium resistance protein CzcA